MLSDKIHQLEAAKARVASLESEVAGQLTSELAGLPAAYGFDSVKAFVAAVRASAGKRRGRKAAASKAPAKAKGRRRATITDETRASLKKLVEAGKTGNEIAAELGISLPSVQNIKRALGLVRRRG